MTEPPGAGPSGTGPLDFTGRRVLVTGGSGDIGRAICAAFAARGARVAFTWFMDHAGREQTEAETAAAGAGAHPIRCNLRRPEAAAAAAASAVEALGGVDVLVSNAATGTLKPALEIAPKALDTVLRVNAGTLLELARALAPQMQPGGRILAISSAGATRALPDYAAIGASKAALEALVRHLAVELGPRGIAVNAICPGVVDTKALQAFPMREQMLAVAGQRTPAGRIATPKDVADAALLLASPLAEMIRGQVIAVDGGYSVLA